MKIALPNAFLIADDHNRIVLQPLFINTDCRFINACYIEVCL